MSGPVTSADCPPIGSGEDAVEPATVELLQGREATVGALRVRRTLPRRAHRTVGAWCFADHLGPVAVTEDQGVDIGPHPHIGLQTVTWLLAGEVLHRDSLGSEQLVRAGELNLMTAGHGVAHAEERTGRYQGDLHGIQLWVAQPEPTRHGPPAFEHHAALPERELEAGVATVFVGELDGVRSPARRDTDHVGVDLALRAGRSTLPVRQAYEHALVVLSGVVSVDGTAVEPGVLAYLGTGREELVVASSADARAVLLGGTPFPEQILMWWNFVARTPEEIDAAASAWNGADPRFGTVDSALGRIDAPATPWGGSR